jgi:hypothetical protein
MARESPKRIRDAQDADPCSDGIFRPGHLRFHELTTSVGEINSLCSPVCVVFPIRCSSFIRYPGHAVRDHGGAKLGRILSWTSTTAKSSPH